ncbi:MAG: 4Fe-4S dicluster domain-containing protein [Deltaproteobacteria bacterium]|nr:4Fe-4S dicluster domain-containing protein [Deltaproteobacteria bacterium]MBW1984052.1 4Fe-4S dicluster domain-containing protein [Deltaproteobacteria bacterium]MBW2180626.1 4Fe-4S dicluster domain-containing protein [Deltaproteobacteria bacterium]MBW2363906.1 4Fe-4S dicluster domain-containing protein [Deltaproteobacteria bacterium]
MKVNRKIIEIDDDLCDGCGQCLISCAEGALEIIDGKAKVVADKYCDGLGACLGECPVGALHVVEREADEFDEEAVEAFLAEKEKNKEEKEETMACGCPSTQIQNFESSTSCEMANRPANIEDVDSALSHWPVQIRLVPPTAPFLKGADLLVVADCVPIAFPSLHRDFLKGKVVMVGCPKFDDVQEYIDKFAAIFETADIKSITTLVMEVPCCSGLPGIVKKGLEASGSGKNIPLEEVVVSVRGKILEQNYQDAANS